MSAREYLEMSNLSNHSPKTIPGRPCAFCQAIPPARFALLPVEPASGEGRGSHTCMLHAGKTGPDGKPISPNECTIERQVECQSQRRLMIARLCAQPVSLPVSQAAR